MSISRRLLLKALFSRNPGKVLATAASSRGLMVGYVWGRAILEGNEG